MKVWILYKEKRNDVEDNELKFHSVYDTERLALVAKAIVEEKNWRKNWVVVEKDVEI